MLVLLIVILFCISMIIALSIESSFKKIKGVIGKNKKDIKMWRELPLANAPEWYQDLVASDPKEAAAHRVTSEKKLVAEHSRKVARQARIKEDKEMRLSYQAAFNELDPQSDGPHPMPATDAMAAEIEETYQRRQGVISKSEYKGKPGSWRDPATSRYDEYGIHYVIEPMEHVPSKSMSELNPSLVPVGRPRYDAEGGVSPTLPPTKPTLPELYPKSHAVAFPPYISGSPAPSSNPENLYAYQEGIRRMQNDLFTKLVEIREYK